MAVTFSLGLPQGFTQELAGRLDPAGTFDAMVSVAQRAERAGYESVYVADHLVTVPPSQNMLFECWTTVAALLRETERIRVGQLVTCNDYRHPALQAKMASTVDAIGGGRFTFGIGAGWYEPDYRSYGFEFRDDATRLRRLQEAVQIILSMWTEQETTFKGQYYTVADAINQPKGVQSPHIPMMIAGGGERMTLKVVAKYADLCNLLGDPATVAHKLAVLRRHCEAVGRDFGAIRKTVLMYGSLADTEQEARSRLPQWIPAVFPGELAEYGLVGTAATVRERIAAYEAVGVDEFIISFPDVTGGEVVEGFAEAFIA
ncbi:LLM class F420-dependent oxidoreductase [Catenulispora rubra]|uniref:LLM class F420-dependent oxidoreductase n=1 Tax=Catenulispora rubra TaxID=280293 RepID=UPI001892578F|nr:LLM class F420-dependent oxidoreductase [Catenulispora rubra]